MPTAASPLVLAPTYDAIAAWGIGGLAVCMAAVVWAVATRWRAVRAGTAAAVIVGWMTLTAAVAASGQLARFDRMPPPMTLLIASVVALALAAGLSPLGGRLAAAVPLSTLVLLQGFRLPLELAMHRATTLGIMPPEMSYSGYNLDIVTGAGALVNTCVLFFPYVWLPAVLVTVALAGHLVVARALRVELRQLREGAVR